MSPRKAAEQLRTLNDESGLLTESADMLEILADMAQLLVTLPKFQEGYDVSVWQSDRARLLSKVLEHSKRTAK